MAKQIKRTQFAQAAFDYSSYFATVMGRIKVQGSCPRVPHMVVPEGMSTAGGKQVRQHIVLQPEAPGFPSVTVGAVDVAKGEASLRTLEYLMRAHQLRFKDRPFDIDPNSYQQFFQQARAFFTQQGMRLEIETPDKLPQLANTPSKSGGNKVVLIVVTVLALLLLAAVFVAGYVYIHYFA